MRLYEIDERIAALVDPETGEILDFDAFADLQIEREMKIEGMALWHKNLSAEADAIKAEENKLNDRRKAIEAKADRLKEYINETLCGEKFTTPKVAISYRKSTAVEIANEHEFIKTADARYLIHQQPKIDRRAITTALKAGETVSGAVLTERNNIQIK